jgi:hypothetical protein
LGMSANWRAHNNLGANHIVEMAAEPTQEQTPDQEKDQLKLPKGVPGNVLQLLIEKPDKLRRWQQGLEVPPALLRFAAKREEQHFFIVDGRDCLLVLESEFPQFLPFALTSTRKLRSVKWTMEAAGWHSWGFFYQMRKLLDGNITVAALLISELAMADGQLPMVMAEHGLFSIDPDEGTIIQKKIPLRLPVDAQKIIQPLSILFELSLQEGDLKTLKINDKTYDIALEATELDALHAPKLEEMDAQKLEEMDAPELEEMNPQNLETIGSVSAPFGFVLRKGRVKLMSPRLEFDQ